MTERKIFARAFFVGCLGVVIPSAFAAGPDGLPSHEGTVKAAVGIPRELFSRQQDLIDERRGKWLKDAELSTAAAQTAVQLSFIRRYRMKDGRTETNPGRCNPETDHAIGEPDNTVRLVRFTRKEGKDIALVNFSTHPDTIAGTKLSADWPGFVRRYVEKDLGVCCILVNGAQGDTNHVDTSIPEKHTGYGHTAFMGRTIADTVVKLWDACEKHPEGKVFSEVEMVKTPSNRTGEDKLDYYLGILKDYEENGTEYPLSQLGTAGRLRWLDILPKELTVPVTVMGYSDVAFVGFGGEPFTEYATRMRAAAPDTFVITVCCANGQQGYLPVESAFAEGGYEAKSSRFTPALPEDVLSAAERMLRKYCK